MTPYAELMVRPLDGDLTIRQQFHVLSRTEHPDRDGSGGVPGPRWYALTAAYGAIKTERLREALAARRSHLSGLCKPCRGLGVMGSRVGGSKVLLCAACKGEGRAARPR